MLECVAWSPDGSRLAVGDQQGGVSLFTTTGRLLWRKAEHTSNTVRLAWHPDGRALASGQSPKDGKAYLLLWDADSGEVLLRREGVTDIYALAWAPDGRRLLWTHQNGQLQILDTRTGEVLHEMVHSGSEIWGSDWSRDGRLIASSSRDKTIRLWQPDSGKCLRVLQGHTSVAARARFSPDSTLLASSSDDKTVRIWDVHSGECLRVLEGHEGYVKGLAWSPQGNLLASTSYDKTVRLWNPDSGELLACWSEHTKTTWDVAFSPDAARLASVSIDGSLKLWDVTAWLPKQPEPEPENRGLRVWLNRQAAAVGRQPPAPVSAEPPQVPEHLPGRTGACLGMLGGERSLEETDNLVKLACSLALSADGKRLHAGTPQGIVRAWELRSGRLLWKQQVHEDVIVDMAVSPDASLVATASADIGSRIL